MGDLDALLREYLEPEQIAAIHEAYELGARAHEGQVRQSGEPYIHHPLAVAGILAEMHLDPQTLQAALLHDVLEDTQVTKEELAARFGEEVAEIVDGVSKLSQIEFSSYEEAQAQNLRKMIMAMANDIRVILVKLADRLHNMRTLDALPPAKRRRKARETLEIYVPIAQRLGMNRIRLELEDLGFEAYYPLRARVLRNEVKKARGHRKEIVKQIKTAIKRRLRQERLAGKVIGREKHLYSIYQKMRNKGLSFSEVYDVYAFRIVVSTVDMCYRVLGAVHNLYKPLPGKFKDYIAIPKSNGYQSLHTVLFGPYGVPIEVQIRTEEMDRVAEEGIAAHWLYKSDEESGTSAHQRAREWLREVLEMQRQAGNSQEFLENVKIDLFPDAVYVFTPKGRIIELPRGATCVDFAYAVHTDVGNHCVGARIDHRMAPLSTRLTTGQTVEILTAPGSRPNPSWLSFVATARARSHIRHYLKNLQEDEARQLGRRMLQTELRKLGLGPEVLEGERLEKALAVLKVPDLDTLLAEVGLGRRLVPLVARAFTGGGEAATRAASGEDVPLTIHGTAGMVINLARCCHPIPGDRIYGHVSSGRGIVIHRENCRNIAEFSKDPDKWLELEWADDVRGEFPVGVRVMLTNQRGALATIATEIANQGANIENVEMHDQDDRYVSLGFVITVRDRVHLARVLRRLRSIRHVSRVSRV
ncbi:MAG: guanosine-3',5'-bis(diphosphate) 3'-diphosphatase [Gammaproteobacteria bacterium]|nr:MAG: guanosine-3',5'-bis(diphosphate) 3'-diphosphatase [Gammaproteobacteria bacterium]